MRRYLLDTSPLGAYLQGREPAVTLIVPWIRRGEAAATALERNLTVVTTDSDYERVPGLKVQRISLKRG
jgi:hypothetical protein